MNFFFLTFKLSLYLKKKNILIKTFSRNFFSDDLLNYDIGDVIDDQVLYGADEDELLLSDDG